VAVAGALALTPTVASAAKKPGNSGYSFNCHSRNDQVWIYTNSDTYEDQLEFMLYLCSPDPIPGE
jgi:hypothetical protein